MPKVTFDPRFGIEKYLYDYEFHIRASLKRVYNGNTFGFREVRRCQWVNVRSLRGRRPVVPVTAFHLDWSTIDDRRASAACLYEQFRARVWALGHLRRGLSTDYRDLHHLTFARTKDRRPSGSLTNFNLPGYRRAIRTELGKLQEAYPNMWAVGIIEVSASPDTTGEHIFEPHLHLLIDGVPKKEIRARFKTLVGRTTKGSKPIKIKPVPNFKNLGRGLSYFLKFAPELRSKFLTDEGQLENGLPNHMRGDLKAEWLAWLAAYRIDELLITVGLRPEIMNQFKGCELQRLIERLP